MPASASPGTWNIKDLRFPKPLDNDPRALSLHGLLKANCHKLWEGGSLEVPTLQWTEPLAAALAEALRQKHVVQGVDRAERALAQEARGIALVDARSDTPRGSRVSRLLLTSNDGAERFYRQIERLLRTQGARLLVVRLNASSEQLSRVTGDPHGMARALLIEHKLSVASVLLSWCKEAPKSSDVSI